MQPRARVHERAVPLDETLTLYHKVSVNPHIKRAIPRKERIVRRLLKGFAILVGLGVFGLGALLVSLWLEHGSEMRLPTPTGPFAVGRAIYDWVDDAGS